MSDRRPRAYELRSNLEPHIINRDPVVIERNPEDCPNERASSQPRIGRSRTVWSLYNPLSRRHQTSVIVSERTRPQVTSSHRRGASDGSNSSFDRYTSNASGWSSPPQPPIIVQERSSRSLSPFSGIRMPPTHGSAGFVSLPPKIPPEERQRDGSRGNESGRVSQQSRRSEATENIVRIIEEPDRSRRTPAPYRSHADPLETHEQVVPTSPRPRQERDGFEVIQPNVSVGSRRNNDILKSTEYLQMKEIAQRNYEAAKNATERCSRAEVSIQNLQHDLAEMTTQVNRANEISDNLRHELERRSQELDKLNTELGEMRREQRIITQQAKVTEDQLDLERQRRAERERDLSRDNDRERESSKDKDIDGSGSSGGRRRRHRHRDVRIIQEGDRRDTDPRTPDPRGSNLTNAGTGPTTLTGILGGSGMDAIREARADAARRRLQS